MSGNRQRLRPWLVAKIDSGDIRGLYWINKEKTIFRIPWKHGGKQDWAPEHSQIFMEWAKHTGKFREGLDNPEWAKWKTRLRCAFNKAPDIMEIKEKSDTDATDPYKIYMFRDVDKATRGSSRVKKEAPVREEVHTVAQQPMLPGVLDSFNRSNTSSELASLPEDLKGIKSLELVQGTGTPELSMMSTGSLPSFSNQPEDMETDTKEQVAVDPDPFPTNAATGAPLLLPTTSSSPQLGSGAVTLPYTPHPMTSPAASDVTFEFAPSPAMSDTSGTSGQTLYAPGSVSSAFSPVAPASSSPPQGDLPYPPQVTPVELESCSPPNSIELPDSAQLTLLNVQDLKLQELPSHLVTAPGAITLLCSEGGISGEVKVIVSEETRAPQVVQGTEMHVRMQYLDAVVLEEWVTDAHGCRLHYGSDSDIRALATKEVARKMLGPPEAVQLELPPCDGLIENSKRREYTQMLLDNVKRGVYLECINGDIYATRFCRCIVYYCNEEQQTGVKLNRHKRTRIFNFSTFLQAFRAYKERGGAKPSPEACLSFGQQSHYKNLAESTLIAAYILSAQAFNLLEEGDNVTVSSGCEVDDMQISDCDEMDRQMDFFSFNNL